MKCSPKAFFFLSLLSPTPPLNTPWNHLIRNWSRLPSTCYSSTRNPQIIYSVFLSLQTLTRTCFKNYLLNLLSKCGENKLYVTFNKPDSFRKQNIRHLQKPKIYYSSSPNMTPQFVQMGQVENSQIQKPNQTHTVLSVCYLITWRWWRGSRWSSCIRSWRWPSWPTAGPGGTRPSWSPAPSGLHRHSVLPGSLTAPEHASESQELRKVIKENVLKYPVAIQSLNTRKYDLGLQTRTPIHSHLNYLNKTVASF